MKESRNFRFSIRNRLLLITLLTTALSLLLIYFVLRVRTEFNEVNVNIVKHNRSTALLSDLKSNLFESFNLLRTDLQQLQMTELSNQLDIRWKKTENVWNSYKDSVKTAREKELSNAFDVQLKEIKESSLIYVDSLKSFLEKSKKEQNKLKDELKSFYQVRIQKPESELFVNLDQLIKNQLDISENSLTEEKGKLNGRVSYYIMISIFFLLVIILLSILTSLRISSALNTLRNAILSLSHGDLRDRNINVKPDEFGDIGQGIIDLRSSLQKVTEFANKVGEGDLQTQFTPLGENDELGSTLINMRQKLSDVAEEDRKRNWAITGIAKFSEIVRFSPGIKNLAENIITQLPKYIEANQAAFFILDDQDSTIHLLASYAYTQTGKSFKLGEGFVGQSAKSKEVIEIHDIPTEYVTITSGLGETKPKSLLLVPMLFNEKVQGVIEFSTLTSFSAHQIEFVKRLCEIFGAAIANLKSNDKTLKLLKESQDLSEELRFKQEQLIENNRLMQETQEKLLKSQQELSGQLNAMNQAAIVSEADIHGKILFVNSRFIEISQYGKEDLIGQNYRILHSGLQGEHFFKNLWESILQGKVWRGEIRNRNRFGGFFWVDTTITPVIDSEGKITKFITIQFDISNQKMQDEQLRHALEQSMAQEEELRQNAEELEATAEEMKRTQIELTGQITALNSAAIVSEVDLQGRIFNMNDQFLKITKYKKEEIIGQNHRILKSGHQNDDIFMQLWETIVKGVVWKGEIKNRAKDGTFYWVALTITPVLGVDAKPVKYIGVAFDITAQKFQEEQIKTALEISVAQEAELRQNAKELIAAQEEMRKTQVELRGQIGALNNAGIVSETDLRGNISILNDEFIRLSKYSREELLMQNHRMLKSGQHHPAIYAELWQTISAGNVWKGELCNKAKDGSFYWVKCTITPVLGYDGKPVKYIGVSFDISAQKKQADRIKQALDVAQAQEEELRNNQLKLIDTQYELKGQINAINNATIVFETDTEGKILTINDELMIVSKYSREELIGQKPNIFKSGQQTDEIYIQIWHTITKGKVWHGELCNQAKSGDLFWVATTITPVLDTDSKPVKFICVQFEITKIKTQEVLLRESLQKSQYHEEELRKKQEQVDSIFANIPGVIYRRKPDEDWTMVLINNFVLELTGFQSIELLHNRRKSYINLIHEDDIAEVKKQIFQSLAYQQPYHIDYRIVTKDMKIKWVKDKGKGLYDENGQLLWVDGTLMDITLQRELEENLKNTLTYTQTQQKLLESQAKEMKKTQIELDGQIGALNHAALVSETDLDGKIIFVNDEACKIWGFERFEIIGKKHSIIKSSEHSDDFWKEMWLKISTGQVWSSEVHNKSQDGDDFWVQLSITPVLDEYRKPVKFIGVAFDITKQKNQAQRIKQFLETSQKKEEELRTYAETLESIQKTMLETQVELTGQINALNNAAIVFESDVYGNLTFVNQSAIDIWGYNEEQMLQKDLSILGDNDLIRESLLSKIGTGEVWMNEIQTINAQNQVFWLHLTCTPVIGMDDKPYKFIAVGYDITQQKIQSQRIREALRQAREDEKQYKTQIDNLQQDLVSADQFLARAVLDTFGNLIQYNLKFGEIFNLDSVNPDVFLLEKFFPDQTQELLAGELRNAPFLSQNSGNSWLFNSNFDISGNVVLTGVEVQSVTAADFQQINPLTEIKGTEILYLEINQDGNIDHFSKSWLEIGFQEQDLDNQPFGNLLHEDNPEDYLQEMAMAMTEGFIWKGNLKLTTYNSSIWIHITWYPSISRTGVKIIGWATQVTNWMNMVENLEEERKVLTENLESVQTSIAEFKNQRFELQQQLNIIREHSIQAEFDSKGFFISANEKFYELTQSSESNLWGKKVEILLTGLKENLKLEVMESLEKSGRYRGLIGEGDVSWLKINLDLYISVIQDINGKPYRYWVMAVPF